MPQTVLPVFRGVVLLLIMCSTARLTAQTAAEQESAFSVNTATAKKIYDEDALDTIKHRLVYDAQLLLNILAEPLLLHSRISVGIIEKAIPMQGLVVRKCRPGAGMLPATGH